jgi:glycosyltransferase involved in cell wall biosynthesis
MRLLVFNLKTDADAAGLGFTTDWINALAERVEHVIVITMMVGRLSVSHNVEVLSVGKEKGFSEARRLYEFYRLLWRVLRQKRVDACFAHMMPLFAVLGSPLLKAWRIPTLLWYAHSHVSAMLHLATFLVDRVVTANKSGFRIDTSKVRFIGHGIDTQRFPLISRCVSDGDRFVILSVGRISPIKKLEVVILALARLPSEHLQHVELRFVGEPLRDDGKLYAESLKRLVDELELSGSVRFLPALAYERIHEAYASADVFVNSSDTDSVDKSVLEAICCGLPIITSNVAFVDLLGPELAPICVVPKNDPVALAERLLGCVEMTCAERRHMGLRLRKVVKKDHSLSALADRLVEHVNELMGKQ